MEEVFLLEYLLRAPSEVAYEVRADFAGYLPIFGGQVGKVGVRLLVKVRGLADTANQDSKRSFSASMEVVDGSLSVDGEALPLGVSEIRKVFPLTTIRALTTGKLLEVRGAASKIPITLPGMDPGRLSDLTFLPIEFSPLAVAKGRTWRFERTVSDFAVHYVCSLEKITDKAATIAVTNDQTLDYWVDDGLNRVEKESDAVMKVHVDSKGTGSVEFDRTAGMIDRCTSVIKSKTTETKIVSGEKTEHDLTTTFTLKRLEKMPAPEPEKKDGSWLTKAVGTAKLTFAVWNSRASRVLAEIRTRLIQVFNGG